LNRDDEKLFAEDIATGTNIKSCKSQEIKMGLFMENGVNFFEIKTYSRKMLHNLQMTHSNEQCQEKKLS
jgi:hypothetical protein